MTCASEQEARARRDEDFVQGVGLGTAKQGPPRRYYHIGRRPSAQQRQMATALKEQGNDLYKAGRHAEAVKKYDEALQVLKGLTDDDAKDTTTKCRLNKVACLPSCRATPQRPTSAET